MDGLDLVDIGNLAVPILFTVGAVAIFYNVYKKPAQIRGLSGIACGKLKGRYGRAYGKRRSALKRRAKRAHCTWA